MLFTDTFPVFFVSSFLFETTKKSKGFVTVFTVSQKKEDQ